MEFNPSERNYRRVPVYSSRYAKNATLIAMGDAIRRARSALGIAQEELALMAELDRSYLGGIERGQSNMTLLNVIKIATALGMNASELLEQAGL